MTDKANENLNIEAGAAGILDNTNKTFEVGKSKLSDKEISEAAQKAADLAKIEKENFEINKTIQGDEINKNIPHKNVGTLPPDIKTAINNLPRPDDVKEGLGKAYLGGQDLYNDGVQTLTKIGNRFAGLFRPSKKT